MKGHHQVLSPTQEARLLGSRHTGLGVFSSRTSLGVRQVRDGRRLRAMAPAERLVSSASPKLAEIEIHSVLNDMGYIQPLVENGAKAYVFAIYDQNQKLQYIGFSKDIQGSLRSLFSRRPDKAYYYKFVHFADVDQKEMVDTRGAWFEEVGGAPPGNKLAMERTAWQQPIDVGSNSDKTKLQAAEDKSKELIEKIRERGCREQFMPNATLLVDGLVDFLPAQSLSPEQLAEQKKVMDKIMQSSRTCKTVIDGEESEYTVFFRNKYPTNGGYMCDISVSHDNMETRHRVIIGKTYYEPFGVEPEHVVELCFNFILAKKVPRQTEGMLMSSQFPVNYFSVSELEQWFDEFKDALATIGKLEGSEVWRFNRLFDYGGKMDDVESLNMALAKEESSSSSSSS